MVCATDSGMHSALGALKVPGGLTMIQAPQGQDPRADTKKGFQPYHSKSVPKSQDLQAYATDSAARGIPVTTLMLRNIPNKYTQNSLMQEITKLGFEGSFDFFYLPMDIHNRSNVGYAFINFVTSEEAERFRVIFAGREFERFHCRKVGGVCDAHLQGLDANIRHFQHRAVTVARNDQYRPLVFRGQERIKFEDAEAEVLPRTMQSFASCSTCDSLEAFSSDASMEAPLDGKGKVKKQKQKGKKAKKDENRNQALKPGVHEPPATPVPSSDSQTVRNETSLCEDSKMGDSEYSLGSARQGLEVAIRELLSLAAPRAEDTVVLAKHNHTVLEPCAVPREEPCEVPLPGYNAGHGATALEASPLDDDVLQLLSLRNLLVCRLLESQSKLSNHPPCYSWPNTPNGPHGAKVPLGKYACGGPFPDASSNFGSLGHSRSPGRLLVRR